MDMENSLKLLWGTTLLFSICLMKFAERDRTELLHKTAMHILPFERQAQKYGFQISWCRIKLFWGEGGKCGQKFSFLSKCCLKSKFYKPGPKGLIGNGLFLQEWCLGDCDNSYAQQNLWGFRKLSLVIPEIPLKCEHKISQQNSTRTSTWKHKQTKAPQCTHKYSMISTSSKSTSGILSINSLLSWAASFKLIFILINFNSPLSWAACFIN